MPNWNYTIDIKQHLGEGTDPASVKRAKLLIAAELETISPFQMGRGAGIAAKLRKVYTCDKFNKVLDEVYDFADEHRIWLGLK